MLLLFGFLSGLYFYLPYYLESKIVPQLEKETGLSDLAIDIRTIGILNSDLGVLQIGPKENPGLIIRSVHVDYSPAGLYQKQINNVIVSGVEVHCEYNNGEFRLRGIDLKDVIKKWQSRQGEDTGAKSPSPPLSFKNLTIRNGTVILDIDDMPYRVPFEIDILAKQNTFENLTGNARIFFRGHQIRFSADVNLPEQKTFLKISAPDIKMSRYSDLIQLIEGLFVSGRADLAATAELQLAPLQLFDAQAELILNDGDIRYKNLEFRHLGDKPKQKLPFHVKIERIDHTKWHVNASKIAAVSPIPMQLDKISATIEQAHDGFKSSGNFKLLVEPAIEAGSWPQQFRFIEPFEIVADFSGIYSNSEMWQFSLTSVKQPKANSNHIRIHIDPFEITSNIPEIHVAGSGNSNKNEATYTLNVAKVRAVSKDVNLLLPKIVLSGRADLSKKVPITQAVVLDLKSPATSIKLGATKINLNKLAANWRIQRSRLGNFKIESKARFAKADIKSSQMRFQIADTRVRLPLKWPFDNPTKKGELSVAEMQYSNLKLGALKATLNQTATGITFAGNLTNQFLKALSAEFSGHSKILRTNSFETNVHFEISYPEAAPEIKLERFLPAAKGFTFKGKLLEVGDIFIKNGAISGSTRMMLENGHLFHRENNISVKGIQTDLFIEQLVDMRSAPGQQIKFAKASFGGLSLENGKIDFQIESNRSVLIEKSHFIWCDGKVDAPAIRLTSGVDDYNLILYCDRLNLAKVLEQFSAARVEAEGELNGRIDLRYQNGDLSFDDGFLYTTPGEPGKIRMFDTDILTAGIPEDSPQYVQMEIARKALEDYDYSWAKLNINSEGEYVLLKMQLDGKPANPLPFVYRKDIGSFAKIEAGVEGSRFQGIRLDVNFRLPLNKLMQYKDLIRMIQSEKE